MGPAPRTTIFFLSVGFMFALNSSTLYYKDVDLLELESAASLDKELIKQNYDEIVEYIKPTSKTKLQLSNFTLSDTAKKHLYEVKNICGTMYRGWTITKKTQEQEKIEEEIANDERPVLSFLRAIA